MPIHQALITRIKPPGALSSEFITSLVSQAGANIVTSATIGSTANFDCTNVTSNDLFVLVYQGEGGGAGGTFYAEIQGQSVTTAVSNTNTEGRARVAIYYCQGSRVAGNADTQAQIFGNSGGYRASMQGYRLVNGATATVASTDIDEDSGDDQLSITLNHSEGQLFVSGFYSNGQGHTFGTGQLSNIGTGVQNAEGSGNFGRNTTPGNSSRDIDYNRNGTENNQGDALCGCVFR